MKTYLRAALLVLAVGPAAASAADWPALKPGLWELQTGLNASGAPATGPEQRCVDAATDAKMQLGAQMAGQHCSQQETRHEAGKYITDSVCRLGRTIMKSHTVAEGDFSSNYEVSVTASYDPPLMGIKEGRTKIKAKWLGPCPKNLKPGETLMPGGIKINSDMTGK